MLEVFGTLPASEVTTGQIGRATDEFGQDFGKLVDGGFRQLAATNGRVLGGVGGQGLFPTFGKAVLDTALQLSRLGGVLFTVRLEELGPFLFELVAGRSELAV